MYELPLPKVVADVGPGGGIPSAINALNDIQKKSLENKFYAPNIESQIGYRNSLKTGQDITNQYLPDQLKLANAFHQLQNQYYAPNIQSEISERNSLTNKNNLENKWIDRLNEAKILSAKALASYRQSGGFGRGTGGKDIQDISNQIRVENPEWTPEQITDATNAYLEGRETFSDGTPLPPASGSINSLLESSFKRRTDVAQRNQERYADTVETAIKSAEPNAKIAAKYSGFLGGAEGTTEKLSAALGGSASKDYQAFNNFINVDVPTLAGEYMRQLGVNASDEQKKLYKNVVNPISWVKNPETALAQWDYFKKLAKDVGVTVSKSPFKRSNDLRKLNNNQPSNVVKNIAPSGQPVTKRWVRNSNGQLVMEQ